MKKICLILILVLSFVSTGVADNFKIKPKFYWSIITPLVVNPKINRWGITALGFDGSLFQCGNFYFPAVGIGLQAYQKRVIGWHTYNNYYGYPQSYYGEGYEFFFEPYLKIVPIKYRWTWARRTLRLDSYLEIGFAINPFKAEKDILITLGVTFSGNPFKKKKK